MGYNPIFRGVFWSWFSAAIITLSVITLFSILPPKNKGEKIFKKNNALLAAISIVVLFYISINLASEALTGKGVPIFSDPFQVGHFTNVSPQDVFFILFGFIIIFSIIFQDFIHSKLHIKHGYFISIWVGILIICLVFLFTSIHAVNISESSQKGGYLFIWNDIPGNDDKKLIGFLKEKYDIKWVDNAKIEKIDDGKTISLSYENNSLSLKLNDDETKAVLKIADGTTDEFIAEKEKEKDKLNIYEVVQIWPFIITIILGFLIATFFYILLRKQSIQKKFKEEFWDLVLYFSIIPAFVVASLALIGHQLLRSNIFGNMVVGFLFISGFATLMILTTISINDLYASRCICRDF